jgi:DNA invertase Pin-like site-specific DNA recombinase
MTKAVIYLRVSTADQAKRNREPEGYSIPAQREACLRKAEQLEAEVVEEYVDRGESAKSADRTELKRMLARLKDEGDVRYVIVHKVDRLARNRHDDVVINLAIREAGAQLVSVSENIDETPSGKLMHGIMASIAEFYSRNLAAESLKGLTQKAKAGGTPGRAPIGYLNVRTRIADGREIRTIEIDPDRAPHVRWAFEAYATGAYTLDTITAELERRGLRTRPTPRYPSRPLARSRVGGMFRNPYYIGIVRWNGGLWPGEHETLVDRETFDRVGAVLTAHDVAGEKDRKHNHYLKGSVFCARCDSRLCLTHAKGKYLYFFCLGRAKGTGCDQPYVPAHRIEEAVENFYANIVLEPERRAAVQRYVQGHLDHAKRTGVREAESQRTRLTRLKDEQRTLLRAHYAGAVPIELLREEQQRIGNEIAQADQRLKATELRFEQIECAFEDALMLGADCQRMYREAPPQVRRQANQTIFEKLRVHNDEVVGAELAEPFAQLLAYDAARRLEVEAQPVASPENETTPFLGAGSNKSHLVAGAGFEPATFGL